MGPQSVHEFQSSWETVCVALIIFYSYNFNLESHLNSKPTLWCTIKINTVVKKAEKCTKRNLLHITERKTFILFNLYVVHLTVRWPWVALTIKPNSSHQMSIPPTYPRIWGETRLFRNMKTLGHHQFKEQSSLFYVKNKARSRNNFLLFFEYLRK